MYRKYNYLSYKDDGHLIQSQFLGPQFYYVVHDL